MSGINKSGIFACVLLAACAAAEQDDVQGTAPARFVDVSSVAPSDAVLPSSGIATSGQPPAEAFDVFAATGYRAVIDLRGEGEDRGFDEPAVVEASGMTYFSLPIANQDAVNFDNAARLKTLLDQQDGPVLIHCGSGNRVGALLALIESQAGADDEAAIESGKAAGLTRLEPVVRQRLAEKASQ